MSGPDTATDSAEALVLDDKVMRFRFDDPTPLDVLFDGRRVWSIAPHEHRVRRDGYRQVAWPEPIRRHLDGAARVELREHVSGTVVASTEAVFGTGSARVEIVDDSGRPVALTKYGRLNHPFESSDRSSVEGYLDQVEEVLTVLRDRCGLPAFVSFGTLLGAVRDGRLIGHDVDVDLGYLSDYEHPVDIVRESLRVERVLRDQGWRVVRENGGFLALFFPQADGTSRNLDVFACFIVNGMLHQVHDIRTPADRSAVVPLGEVELEGRILPAPARPEVFLEAAYGPGWRVPDPSFEYHTPRALKRRVMGWLGGLRAQRDQWSKFYAASYYDLPDEPSAFARWVARREAPAPLLDVGCGKGRDALFFAAEGFDVTALDVIPKVLSRARRSAQAQDAHVSWQLCNLNSLQETLLTAAAVLETPGPRVVYARGLLHDLRPAAWDHFWRLTSLSLRGGGSCYVEWRTADPRASEPPALPIRRRLSVEDVEREARARGARSVRRAEELHPDGLDPDRNVHRLVLEW